MVLWIVPTTQIYRQTLKNLKDRNHPYRRVLDIKFSTAIDIEFITEHETRTKQIYSAIIIYES